MKTALLILFILLPVPVRGEEAHLWFDMSIFGITLGELEIIRDETEGAYQVQAHFATKGAVGVLARVFFDLSATGRMQGAIPHTETYTENMDTGWRKTRAQVTFAPGDARLDPLSGLFAGLGDRPRAQGCAIDREIFDGVRSHRLTITADEEQAHRLICSGRYVRTAGYSRREMVRHKGYDFTVTYSLQGDRLIADAARADTTFGKVLIQRRAVSTGTD